MISSKREKFKNIYNKRLDKIEGLFKKNDFGELNFIISNIGTETDFSKIKDPVVFLHSIKEREISI